MDTRFTKVSKLKFPLYKVSYSYGKIFKYIFFKWKIRNRSETFLKKSIADDFELNEANIKLYQSGCAALLKILEFVQKAKSNHVEYIVCIPSFACREIVDVVKQAKFKIRFYEIDQYYNPAEEFLKEIDGKENVILLLTSLFGRTPILSMRMKYFQNQNYIIIYDEAQLYPMRPRMIGKTEKTWFSIISFGKSKPVSSIGGGGLIIHNPFLVDKFEDNILPFHWHDFFIFVKEILNNNMHIGKKGYNSLEQLHDHYKRKLIYNASITEFQCGFAYMRISEYKSKRFKNYLLKQKLVTTLVEIYGNNAVKLIRKDLRNQGVITLVVDNNRRTQIARELSNYGIQTTFYYYPLHLIEKQDTEVKGNFDYTYYLAGGILIFPFNIDYQRNDIKKICNLLKKGLS